MVQVRLADGDGQPDALDGETVVSGWRIGEREVWTSLPPNPWVRSEVCKLWRQSDRSIVEEAYVVLGLHGIFFWRGIDT